MHTEFHRISWIYERGGGSYLLNLNSNLNPVEKEEKRKINLKERKSRIRIYIHVIFEVRVFIDAAGTQVRISISKLLDLPRFDDTPASTDYRFVVRTTIHWQLARGIYQDFVCIRETHPVYKLVSSDDSVHY